MLRSSFIALGLAGALAVSSCQPGGGPSAAYEPTKLTFTKFEAEADKLETSSFRFKSKVTTDIPALVAALPPAIAVAYDEVAADARSGATALRGVRVTLADNAEVGVRIGELKLWGLDTALAVARLGGQRLEETAPLARRVEALDVSLFGLETLFQPMIDAANEGVADAVEQAVESGGGAVEGLPAGDLEAALDMELTAYNFSIARLIVDDLVLRPFEMTPVALPADSDFAEVLPWLQSAAAYSRAYALNTLLVSDLKAELAYEQMGAPSKMALGVGEYALKGSRGGDLDLAYLSNTSFDLDISPAEPAAPQTPAVEGETPVDAAPPAAPAAPAKPVRLSGAVERYEIEGVRLEKALGHLARGVMPAKTETAFMSLGVFRTRNEAIQLGGKPFYSVAESTADLRGWHWLVPRSLQVSAKDVVYDLRGLVDFAADMAPDGASDAEGLEQVRAGLDKLAAYGLDRPSMDLSLGWNWNPDDGAGRLTGLFGVDDFLSLELAYDGGFPDWTRSSALIADDFSSFDADGFAALFAETGSFRGAEIKLVDSGGLEKAFALAIEFARMMPAEDPGAQMLAGQTPEALRQMASAGVMMGGGALAAQFPPAQAVANALGSFIAQGGRLTLSAKPPEPIVFASAAMLLADPVGASESLGVTAVHEPPPGAN